MKRISDIREKGNFIKMLEKQKADLFGPVDIDKLKADLEKTYKIVRFQFGSEDREIIKTGLTLDEAQEHCSREDTHGDGWFDGYYEE